MSILVLGDSHTQCFSYYRGGNITVTSVTGASAQGLTNWESKLGARQQFIQSLFDNKGAEKLFLFLGEVDCNATIWAYRYYNNTGLLNQINRSIDNYKSFVENIAITFFDPVDIYILSPILPVTDNQMNGVRKDLNIKKIYRTKVTNIYSKKLEKMSSELTCNYCTVNDLICGPDGLIKENIPSRENDHHLNKKFLLSLWKKRLPI